MGVVCVELLVGRAKLDELLEVAKSRCSGSGLVRPLDRLSQIVELDLVAVDIHGIGDHSPDFELEDLGELAFPVAHVRLGGGDYRFLRVHAHRQDMEAGRVGRGHHFGHRRKIYFQRIDVHVLKADPSGHPLSEGFDRMQPVRRLQALPILVCDHQERMRGPFVVPALLLELVGHLTCHQAILYQPVKHLRKAESVLDNRGFDRCHQVAPLGIV